MFNRPLSSFVPSIYNEIVEMDDIINSEENILDIARREMSAAFANTFVLTSDESGVIMFEKILNIIANPQTESLEFRRQRILNRLSMSPPFTFKFLKQKLDEIIGVGAWSAYIDYGNYTLYVESSAANQNWYSEMAFTVNQLKPCNLVFVNVPYTSENIKLSEEISYTQISWRYRMGSWKLGQHPFSTPDGGGIVKMPEIRSVQQPLLNGVVNFVAKDVAAVLINDEIKVSEFSVKQAADNTATIQYTVTPQMTNLITDIKLLRADDTVLTQSTVYVPVTQTVVSKHTITAREGI